MSTGETPKATVLIIDDVPANLDLLFKHLHRSGYRVLVAQDGQTAVRQAEYAQPDIILLDVMMPGIDGFETCRRLKANEITQEIPVIFMTALADTANKVRGFEVGAIDYVTKPFDRQEVLARLETHLTIRNLQKNLRAEIAEREKVEAALRETMAELQVRNEELDAFAHTVAHNLKSPLGTLMGIAEALTLDLSLPPDEIRLYLESIARSGRKVNNIIDELLVLASVRKREVKPVPLNMAGIVAEAQQRLNDLIVQTQAEVIAPESWPAALGYAPWIEEVWVNYLSNGIKYGGDPPRLRLGATIQPDNQVQFWVRDNGPGLTLEERTRLFKPFTRLAEVRTQGYGLGLSIVRRIVEKLGGQVGVESEGEGSTFSFTLPGVE
jgi:signal transduction histidine kinase